MDSLRGAIVRLSSRRTPVRYARVLRTYRRPDGTRSRIVIAWAGGEESHPVVLALPHDDLPAGAVSLVTGERITSFQPRGA